MLVYRENTVRLAAYLWYREQFVELGRTIEDVGFGATKPWYAEGISSMHDLSARFARDIMGDYGAVSRLGRRMADIGIPFWRWSESNIRRYVNRFRNAYFTYKYESPTKGATMAGLTAARLAGQMFAFYGAVWVFNNIFRGDEEDDLSPRQRTKPHYTLWRQGGDVKDLGAQGEQEMGDIMVLNYMGALTDFGAWVGMEEALAIIGEVNKGRASAADILTTIAKAPVNRFTQGINPILTTPVQLALGREFYPDVFNPRKMRDPVHFTARAMSLGGFYPELARMVGKHVAARPVQQRIANVLLNQIDPGEAAYLEMQSKGYAYAKKVLGKASDFGGSGREARLRYEFRRALRFGDERAAYMLRQVLIIDYRLTPKELNNMIKGMEPLGMLNKVERHQFFRTMSENEKKKFKLSMVFYNRMRAMAGSLKLD